MSKVGETVRSDGAKPFVCARALRPQSQPRGKRTPTIPGAPQMNFAVCVVFMAAPPPSRRGFVRSRDTMTRVPCAKQAIKCHIEMSGSAGTAFCGTGSRDLMTLGVAVPRARHPRGASRGVRDHNYIRGMSPISAERCIGGRDLSEPRLSPNATMLVYAVSAAGTSSLMLSRLDGTPPRQLTAYPQPRPGRGLGGGCWCWTPDSHAVIYSGADGNLWLQPVPGGQ